MKRLTRESIDNLVPYPPGKPVEELERELGIKGSIKLASNENPLGPSPLAVQAILDHVPKLHRYPDGSGFYHPNLPDAGGAGTSGFSDVSRL